jgi:hypothetical protein
MELDHLRLQLFFNVVAITTVTSLTLIWYLRKRDREVLANRLIAQRTSAKVREQNALEESFPAQAEPAVPVEQVQTVEKPQAAAPRVALPSMTPNVPKAASRRAEGWMAPSVAQWNQRLSSPLAGSPNHTSQKTEAAGEQKEVPHSPRIMFPRHEPKTPGVHRLAGPLDLCHTMVAAKYGRVSC